jgi:hypothetical protein
MDDKCAVHKGDNSCLHNLRGKLEREVGIQKHRRDSVIKLGFKETNNFQGLRLDLSSLI